MSGGTSFGQIGSLLGNIVGSYFGPVGGAVGSAIGGAIGGAFDPAIINSGPRLTDLSQQSGNPGEPIAVCFGTTRCAGSVIFLTPIRETKHHDQVGGSAGSTQKAYNDTYTYDYDMGIVVADQWVFPDDEKGITGMRKILANGALVASFSDDADISTLIASGDFCDQITVYRGTLDQMPDPTIEAFCGAGNVSAYRGFTYVVFRGVKTFGKGTPAHLMAFEVVQGGTVGIAKKEFASYIAPAAQFQPNLAAAWVGRDRAMVMNYNTSDSTLVSTTYYEAGQADDPDTATYNSALGHSGFQRTFANCTTAPISYDINFVTDVPTDGMVLRVWDQRIPDASALGGGPETSSNLLIATEVLSVISYPAYTATGNNRCAFEEASSALAYGATNGPGFFYGERVIFHATDGHAECVMPAGRKMIDIAIYLETLYVWNYNATFDSPHSTFHTYLTAYDKNGNQLYDLPHLDDAFSNGGFGWARLCVNEHGTYTWHAGTFTTSIWEFSGDGSTLLCDSADSGDANQVAGNCGFWCDGSIANIGITAVNNHIAASKFWTIQFRAITKGTSTLGYALGILCRSAGLDADEYDVSQQTQTLRGYSYRKVTAPAVIMTQLCTGFYCEGFESEGKIKFTNLGGETVADIPYDDLGCVLEDEGDDESARFKLTRTPEKELPRSLSVIYANWNADFQTGSEAPAKRLTTTSQNDVTVEMPISFTSDEASKRQDTLLYKTWLERDQRTSLLPRKYVFLDTGDPVNVEYPRGTWRRYRVRRTSYRGPCVSIDFVRDEPFVLQSAARGTNLSSEQTSISTFVGSTKLYALDIPILRDQDNNPGWYAAVVGRASGWTGYDLTEKDSTGIYQLLGSGSSQTVAGEALTALGDWTGGNVFDTTNTVRVQVRGGALNSTTRAALFASRKLNACLIGFEIVQFCTATLVSGTTDTYDLSMLLRARAGTSWAREHVVGDRFVLLQTSGLRRVTDQLSDRNVSHDYKAISFGQNPLRADVTTFANTENGLRPLPPVNLIVVRESPLRVTCNRRSRLSSRLFRPVPLGETTEAYEWDVIDPSDNVVVTISTPVDSVEVNFWQPAGRVALGNRVRAAKEVSGVLYALVHYTSPSGIDGEWLAGIDPDTGEILGSMDMFNFSGAGDFRVVNENDIVIKSGKLYAASIGGLSAFIGKWDVSTLTSGVQSPSGTRENFFDMRSTGPQDLTVALIGATSALWEVTKRDDCKLRAHDYSDLSQISFTALTADPITDPINASHAKYDAATQHIFILASVFTAPSVRAGVVVEVDVTTTTPTVVQRIPLDAFGWTIEVFGSLLFVSSQANSIDVYDIATATKIRSYPTVGLVDSEGFQQTPNGLLAASVAASGVVYMFDSSGNRVEALRLPSPNVVGSTTNGLVINTQPGDFSTMRSDIYQRLDLTAGYKAQVFQMSSTVGRGFGSEVIDLG